ncbi:MAG: GatB/YqeY domain-containing protein [Flavobacteriales bacterium TMED288]|nr:glutamyl-tRNA amidotransferase [Flavobacteriales bacterium]RPG53810.1 MAG: GatB/YqeY domain-containing protein [Flavobacteriales bacterium TMED288]|tara:strand:- start:47 stop:502 length:456 start_codon:yes stop_codon:yes gene_type:complete
MSLEKQIIPAIKDAMRNKDRIMLEVLRGIKSEIIKFKTSANGKQELNSNQEIGIIKKMIKQRKESALIYSNQNRSDLADIENSQLNILMDFLPEQMNEEDITNYIKKIVLENDYSDLKDFGKIMSKAMNDLSSKADGKLISSVVKKIINKN